MARLPRIQIPGAWYHVTARGNERRAIFRHDADYHRMRLEKEPVLQMQMEAIEKEMLNVEI